MYPDLLPRLLCPVCRSGGLTLTAFSRAADDAVLDGIVRCGHCGNWFPIDDGLLDLLTGELAYPDDRAAFFARHREALTVLGLTEALKLPGEEASALQRKQQEHFDWYASNDAQTYSAYETQPFWVAVDKLIFDAWRQQLRPNAWLLDIGCAQGRSTFKVLDLDLNVAAFDVSKRLVRQAIDRYRAGRYAARATFFAADATHLPLMDASFDTVLVYGVLHHLPDPAATCHEIARVLAPGGVYFGLENNTTVLRAAFDLLQRLRAIWHEEAGPNALMSAGDFRQWFAGTAMSIQARSCVFVPPHVVNLMSRRGAYRFVRGTDRLGARLPFLRDNGGLIWIRGTKSRQHAPAGD